MQERQYWEGNEITSLRSNEIFVFGSNPSGYHGAGAALVATRFGAQKYKGRGLYGQTYALVTKNLKAGYKEYATGITYNLTGPRSVSKEQIIANIEEFYAFARSHKHLNFLIAYTYQTYPDGKPKHSLNGYTSQETLEMFALDNVPENVIFHSSYKQYIEPLLEKADKNKVLYAPQPTSANNQSSVVVNKPANSGGFKSRVNTGQAPVQVQSKKDLAEIDDMMVDMPDMPGADVAETSKVVENTVKSSEVKEPAAAPTTRFGGGFKPRVRTGQAPVDESAAAKVDSDDFDSKPTVIEAQVNHNVPEHIDLPSKVSEPAKGRFANVRMFGSAKAEPLNSEPVVAAPKGVNFGRGFVKNQVVQESSSQAEPLVSNRPEDADFEMPTFGVEESSIIQTQEPVTEEIQQEAPKRRFGGGFRTRVNTGQAPVDEKAAAVSDLDGDMPVTNLQNTTVTASVDDESPFASLYDDLPNDGENLVASTQEEVKPKGFSSSVKAAKPDEIPMLNEDELYPQAKNLKGLDKNQLIERERPTPENGVEVLYYDEVDREDLIPSNFFTNGFAEKFDGFVTVNSSGDIVAKIEPRTLVEQSDVGDLKINSRALKNMSMVIEKPEKSQVVETNESKKVVEPVKVVKNSVEPAKTVVPENKETVTPKVASNPLPITETPAPAPAPAISNKPLVNEKNTEMKPIHSVSGDLYGDGDEYPEFLQPKLIKEVISMATVNNEPEPVSVQKETLLSEEVVESKEEILLPTQENVGEVQANKPVNKPVETEQTTNRFIRVRNMNSEQLEEYKKQGGNISTVVSTPAPAPVVSAPAPAPVVSTPAPAPVVSTPAPAPVVSTPAPAPVVSTPVPAPVVSAPAPAPVVSTPAPAPVVSAPAPVVNNLPNPSDYTFFFTLHSPFSNFHPAKFEYDGLTFCSNEQFMMLSKAMVFSDYEAFDRIMAHNNTPIVKDFLDGKITREQIVKNKDWADEWGRVQKAIKAEGRGVKNYNDAVWVSERETWVREGLNQKFIQNKDLGDILLATGSTKMVEASPYDDIWGIKLSKLDALKVPEAKWPGKNLLGNLLNDVKKDLSLGLIVPGVIEISQESVPAAQTTVASAPKPASVPAPEKAKPAYNTDEYHFFYSLYSPFSNFHPAPFVYKNIQFVSTEQFYMFSKARLFQNTEVANEIMGMNEHPLVKDLIAGKITSKDILNNRQNADLWFQMTYAIKKIGTQFKDDVWDTKKENVMGVALREKFSQNEHLKQALLETGNKLIVEASEKDKFWGSGVGKDNIESVSPENWPGQNKLGKLLENLREHLKLTPENTNNLSQEKDSNRNRFKPR